MNWKLSVVALVLAVWGAAISGAHGQVSEDAHDSTGQGDREVQMTMDMGQGGHGARPDMLPPVGVMGGHSPKRGGLMLSFQYMRMEMDGNRSGHNRVSTAEVLSQFPVAALSMDMNMFMFSPMYGITDDLSIMAMLPFIRKQMDHVTRTGVEFTTRSDGIGDIKLVLNYALSQAESHVIQVGGGVSVPTGSIDRKDDTPAGPDQVLPYPMQIGSGTYDLLLGITYTGLRSDYSWGAQFGATVRLGENDRDYTLGNIYQISVWGARKWTNKLSSSIRLQGESERNIDGADPRLNPLVVPTADPDLRGGERINLGLGLNFLVPSGRFTGTNLALEVVVPISQDLDGPQVERDSVIFVGLRKPF